MGCEPLTPIDCVYDEPLGFWSMDIETMQTKLDPRMSTCFGLDAEDGARGLDPDYLGKWLHPDDKVRCAQVWQRAIATGDDVSFRYRLRSSTHEYRWVQAQGRCLADADGRVTHIAGILTVDDGIHRIPIGVEIIEKLRRALELAKMTGDGMLPRLIEAVLLHAERTRAASSDPASLN